MKLSELYGAFYGNLYIGNGRRRYYDYPAPDAMLLNLETKGVTLCRLGSVLSTLKERIGRFSAA